MAKRLMQDIVHALVRDGVGARALRLALYRVDGEVRSLDIGLTLPTRDVAHVARLLDLKLDRIVETVDAGFGFEASASPSRRRAHGAGRQTELLPPATRDAERCAALIDSLGQRLGPRSVRRLEPVASHIPERAEAACAPAGSACLAGRRTRRGRAPCSCCRAPSRRTSWPSCPKVRPSASAGAA